MRDARIDERVREMLRADKEGYIRALKDVSAEITRFGDNPETFQRYLTRRVEFMLHEAIHGTQSAIDTFITQGGPYPNGS